MPSLLFRIFSSVSRYINVRMGLIGAVIMGVIVWFINMGFGWWPATTAAMKQALYTFLLGGFLISILERLTVGIKNRYLAVIGATLIVSAVTIALVYLVHSMRGTPRPFESTIPTIIMAPPGFLALSIRKRMRG